MQVCALMMIRKKNEKCVCVCVCVCVYRRMCVCVCVGLAKEDKE